MLSKGDLAPDFTLKGSDDQDYRLADQKGHTVVLIFYPADFSPVCETQHARMQDDLERFMQAGAKVFGISVDSHWTHKAFAKSVKLRYPLLADFHPKGAVAEKYGVYLPERGTSRRVTFVIGPNGAIREVLTYEPGVVPETAPVLSAVGAG